MSSSKEAILLSKLGKKKPLETVDVIRGEDDMETIEEVPSQKVNTVDKLGSSKDLLKATKALSPGMKLNSADLMGVQRLEGSASMMGDSAVPKTRKSYSPIKNYLNRGK